MKNLLTAEEIVCSMLKSLGKVDAPEKPILIAYLEVELSLRDLKVFHDIKKELKMPKGDSHIKN